ncbi:gametocyte-specific factor 1 isoform X1 [Syngnathus scovelli]|uniref:gametocyte-specific factor 1 isoform X1 n=2 Tax=Syngnathus scovelli TaxID=161590 RepID=UPI0035CA22F5
MPPSHLFRCSKNSNFGVIVTSPNRPRCFCSNNLFNDKRRTFVGFYNSKAIWKKMTTIKFGSSINSSLLARSAIKTLDIDNDEKSDINPDKLCQCPFDKSHQIRACRLSYHLLKCKKNHPQLAKTLKTCPFNACHLVPRDELASHTETCPNRVSVGVKDAGSEEKLKVPIRSQFTTATTEDWEAEVDETPIPFVWGVTPVASALKESQAFNAIGAQFRGPNSLPW